MARKVGSSFMLTKRFMVGSDVLRNILLCTCLLCPGKSFSISRANVTTERVNPSGNKIDSSRNDDGLKNFPIYNTSPEYNLLVTYWDKHDRLEDFEISFVKNIENKFIKRIYVFYENFSGCRPDFLESEKVSIIPVAEIAKHKTFYDFANQYLDGQLVIMANADIYFDESLEELKYVNFCIYNVALTRYNYYKSLVWVPNQYCHDTWIFRAPIRFKDADYRFNCFGTEHLLVHDWIQNGYKVINPCLSIFTYHVHKNDYRDPKVVKGFNKYPVHPLPFKTLTESLIHKH